MFGQAPATVAAFFVCLHFLRTDDEGGRRGWLRDSGMRQIAWFASRSGLVRTVTVINYPIDGNRKHTRDRER
jgi:hypothetical protein